MAANRNSGKRKSGGSKRSKGSQTDDKVAHVANNKPKSSEGSLKKVWIVLCVPTFLAMVHHGPSSTIQSVRDLWSSDICLDRLQRDTPEIFSLSTSSEEMLKVHRNGEIEPCQDSLSIKLLQEAIQHTASTWEDPCPKSFDDPHVFDSLLTRAMNDVLSGCHSVQADGSPNDGFFGFCDMGSRRTPWLADHANLVSIPTQNRLDFLPCKFHSYNGRRVRSAEDLSELVSSDRPALYAVPAGRHFRFSPSKIGEIIELPHVKTSNVDTTMELKTLSLQPLVFELINFADDTDTHAMVHNIEHEDRELFRLENSIVSDSSPDASRPPPSTGERGFDNQSPVSLKLQRRGFQVLGVDYATTYADGWQVERYNVSAAKVTAHDMHSGAAGKRGEHNYNASGVGSNRYATIVLHLTDHKGGETVFPFVEPTDGDQPDRVTTPEEALKQLRTDDDAKSLKEGSWEEAMAARCRTKLSLKPRPGNAVLFYTLDAYGKPDALSKNGNCPVLKGQRYSATMWVWNTHRVGYPTAPMVP